MKNMAKQTKITNEPPFKLDRNEYGLLNNLDYEFDELGFVNYRKLIPSEFLVPNRQIFIKKDIPVPKTIEGLEDNQILVLLAGWRWLAKVRGFDSIIHEMLDNKSDSVTIKTTICWRPNYETENKSVCYSALATASFNNTFDFAQNYLAEISENRGFSRAVRGFLNISLVGADEIGPNNKKEEVQNDFSPTRPHGVLQKKLEERGKTFEKFKGEWVKLGNEDAKDWNEISDIPIDKVWEILEMIKKKEK
jgi:hypothetical protein